MLSSKFIQEVSEVFPQLADILNEKGVSLTDTAEGREFDAALSEIYKLISKELLIFAKTLGSVRFNARMYVFEQFQKNEKVAWRLKEMHSAEPDLMPHGIEQLRLMMSRMVSPEDAAASSHRIALWIRSAPDGKSYFVLGRHSNGLETLMAFSEAGWSQLNLADSQKDFLVKGMLKPQPDRKDMWDTVHRQQFNIAQNSVRTEFNTLWKDLFEEVVPDEIWDAIYEIFYLNDEHIMLMRDVARISDAGLLAEATRLQVTLAMMFDSLTDAHKEKIAQMEKSHSRAMNKFKADVARYQAAKDIVSTRARTLEREVAVLRGELKTVNAKEKAAGQGASVGRALDQLFGGR